MKSTLGLLALVCIAQTSGFNYHPFEEMGRQRDGDLIIRTVTDPEKGVRDSMTKWSESTIPYEFSTNISSSDRDIVLAAMKEIEEVSCVRFAPRSSKHSNYVIVTSYYSGCWATLGMHGGAQELNLDPRGCMFKGAIMHQLMHVLGFIHPSSRPDRDLYVKVLLGNVNLNERENFAKVAPGDHDDFGMPYDYDSILHRSGLAFTANGGETIIPLHDEIELGQRDKLSLKDIRKINKMYPCQNN